MRTSRRGFIGWAGVGLAGSLCAPVAAWAERLRILGEVEIPEGRRPPATDASAEFQRWAAGLRADQSKAFESLRVFWLSGLAVGAPAPVATLEEARARDDVRIRELERAAVPELIVENRGKIPVLILAGEILVGGKQNRVLIHDILLPPASGPLRLAVYCVEQGRWAGRSESFDAKGSVAAPRLRAKAMERAGQTRVWAEVEQYTAQLEASSPTHSYQAIYDQQEVRDHLEAAVDALNTGIPAGTVGAAAFVGRTLAGLDCFSDPDLFRREWLKLLRAHAVEAYRHSGRGEVDEGALRARLDGVLRAAATAKGAWRTTPGMGRLFEFRLEAARGAALVVNGSVVHAAIL